MKVFLLFLLAMFFLALRSPSHKAQRAAPLFLACVFVAFAMTTYRLA
jgi:hypothetical protein